MKINLFLIQMLVTRQYTNKTNLDIWLSILNPNNRGLLLIKIKKLSMFHEMISVK